MKYLDIKQSLNSMIIILLAIVFYGCVGTRKNQEEGPPNILFIMVDDLGWSDLSYNGSEVYESPHVDQLAAEGMTFTDFYAGGPVCSPTRASILTGKYTARTGITTYLLYPERDAEHVTPHLPVEEFTLAEALKEQQYSTAYFGKWHLGYSQEHWAANQGFEVALGGMDLPWAWEIAHPGLTAPDVDRAKGHTRFFSPHHLTFMENGPDGEYLSDRLTNETIQFIKKNRKHPFFAFLSFHTVHTPLQAKDEVVDRFKKKIERMGMDTLTEPVKNEKQYQNNPNYAAMVYHMDENVGRLIDSLKSYGLEKKTVIIFTSDNGGKGSVTSNLPLKGMKHNLDEGGIRIPTIVKWPGKIEAGSTCDVPLITNDFYPTILDLAEVAQRPDQHVDGLSFADILLQGKSEIQREAIYWHYPHSRMEGAVRKGDHKLVYYYETGQSHLYNLKDDIGEQHDLSEEKQELSEELEGMLKQWLVEVNAKFPPAMMRDQK